MRTSDFDFVLPPELVAQAPAPERDQSRLLVCHRDTRTVEHRQFPDLLAYLRPGDALILNNSRVIPARLRAVNSRSSGQFEVLLLEQNAFNDWWAMLRPGKRARVGTQIAMLDHQGSPTNVRATVLATNDEGHRRLRFEGAQDISELLETFGEVPLPPYIQRPQVPGGNAEFENFPDDRERYQTVFAQIPGSVAAPTAGLHFTESLLRTIRSKGIGIGFVTLHVGPGTFAPVKTEDISAHPMHEERYELGDDTVRLVNEAKQNGARIVAAGTTTLRVLESVAMKHEGHLVAGTGRTRLFVRPPYRFQVVDVLLTNFHLPRSTLLMLVSAFAAPERIDGRDWMLSIYREAIAARYRFFSYGDAMLLL
jgi:S-adenosylmethionine:tRNA ribosyltransferase-isomerase